MKRKTLAMVTGLLLAAGAVQAQPNCEQAWADYNAFKERNVMEPSEYPLTEYGKAVREACGPEALPVPKGSDTPHRPVIRKRPPPPPPPAQGSN